MESQYARYVIERAGSQIIENKFGFVTYRFLSDGIFIEDLFVEREYRQSYKATQFGQMVEEVGRQNKCKFLYGAVCIDSKTTTEALQFQLKYGMNIYSLSGNMIFLKKEIKE